LHLGHCRVVTRPAGIFSSGIRNLLEHLLQMMSMGLPEYSF
jgi:hypothetical protein